MPKDKVWKMGLKHKSNHIISLLKILDCPMAIKPEDPALLLRQLDPVAPPSITLLQPQGRPGWSQMP